LSILDDFMGFIFVYITNSNKREAKKVASHLLKRRLISCANIFSVNSLYLWKGKIEKANEHVLIVKTLEKNFKKIKREVKKIHSYSVPCITKINVKTNKEYEKWVRKEVR